MSKLNDQTENTKAGLGFLSAIGFTIAGVFLAAWSIVVVAVVIVPAVLAAAVAARTAQWMQSRGNDRSERPLVIEGEYEVL